MELIIADTHSDAKSFLNGGLNADADYEVKGANGTATKYEWWRKTLEMLLEHLI